MDVFLNLRAIFGRKLIDISKLSAILQSGHSTNIHKVWNNLSDKHKASCARLVRLLTKPHKHFV